MKKINSSRWEYSLENGSALRSAINDYDSEETLIQLKNSYRELLEAGKIDEDDFESYTEDIDIVLEDMDYTDEEEFEDQVNYELDEFYSLCDNIGVWIPLD